MTSLSPRYVTVSSFSQEAKHPIPISKTVGGMVNVTKLAHPSKTLADSDFIPAGSKHSSSVRQPLNTLSASEDNEHLLRSTFDTPDPSKAEDPMATTSASSVLVSKKALQLKNARAPIDIFYLIVKNLINLVRAVLNRPPEVVDQDVPAILEIGGST